MLFDLVFYPLYFLKIAVAMCPPKPKVLLMVYFTCRFCAACKVRLNMALKSSSMSSELKGKGNLRLLCEVELSKIQ